MIFVVVYFDYKCKTINVKDIKNESKRFKRSDRRFSRRI